MFKNLFKKKANPAPEAKDEIISAKTVALVQGSWEKVIPIADTAVDIFYTKLFELDPSLKAIFPQDEAAMKGQKNKLRDMLVAAVAGLSNVEKLVPVLQDLGKRHAGYNVEASHYDTVGAALIGTLAAGLGDAFTDEVKDAWVEVYGVMATTMKDAAYA